MKSFSKVRPMPYEKWDREKFVVRFNVVEVKDEIDEGVRYEYDEIIVKEITRKAIIDALISERYDINDEIALAFNRDADTEEKAAHEAYVVECKKIADEVTENLK